LCKIKIGKVHDARKLPVWSPYWEEFFDHSLEADMNIDELLCEEVVLRDVRSRYKAASASDLCRDSDADHVCQHSGFLASWSVIPQWQAAQGGLLL